MKGEESSYRCNGHVFIGEENEVMQFRLQKYYYDSVICHSTFFGLKELRSTESRLVLLLTLGILKWESIIDNKSSREYCENSETAEIKMSMWILRKLG